MMNMLQVLTEDELLQVSGGKGRGDNEPCRPKKSGREAMTNYGAQANGYIGNSAAAGYGLLKDSCSNNIASGMLGGATKGPAGIAGGAFVGALAGGCFDGIGSQSNGNGGGKGGNNCGGQSGGCSW